MTVKIELDAEKVERQIVTAMTGKCATPLAVSNVLVDLYGHEHEMNYGKHIVKPSKIERIVARTIEKVNSNPYATK